MNEINEIEYDIENDGNKIIQDKEKYFIIFYDSKKSIRERPKKIEEIFKSRILKDLIIGP